MKIKCTSYEGMQQIIVVNSVEGEYIATFNINSSQSQLDVSTFNLGTYIITIIDQNGNKLSQSKFVKR